jgi:hypothetical protein
MGITQILSGISSIILRWEKIKIYWPHLVFILLVFILHVQEWWVTYDLRNFNYWRLPTFLFVILYPVNLYLLARLLFPIKWIGRELDLKFFFYKHYRRIYLLICSLAVLAIIDNVIMLDYEIHTQYIQILLIGILASIIIFKIEKEWVHQLVALILLLITVGTFVVTWNTFLITN